MLTVPHAKSKSDIYPAIARVLNYGGRITVSATTEGKALVKVAIPIRNEDDVSDIAKIVEKRRPNTVSKGKIAVELYRDKITDDVIYYLIGIILITNPEYMGSVVNSFVNRVVEVYRKGEPNQPLQKLTGGDNDDREPDTDDAELTV